LDGGEGNACGIYWRYVLAAVSLKINENIAAEIARYAR
jgi:hypothetical protein